MLDITQMSPRFLKDLRLFLRHGWPTFCFRNKRTGKRVFGFDGVYSWRENIYCYGWGTKVCGGGGGWYFYSTPSKIKPRLRVI